MAPLFRCERSIDIAPSLRILWRVDWGHEAYKCQIRTPWWRPPQVPIPDLFFTYMSHRYPRLISNGARVAFLNSMHGIRLRKDSPRQAKLGLPLLMLNSVTMLGAGELLGRSYGGGILKDGTTGSRVLPLPDHRSLEKATQLLENERTLLQRQVQDGLWTNAVKRVGPSPPSQGDWTLPQLTSPCFTRRHLRSVSGDWCDSAVARNSQTGSKLDLWSRRRAGRSR